MAGVCILVSALSLVSLVMVIEIMSLKTTGGIIYFGSASGFLFALNTNTGVEEWKYETTNSIYYNTSPTLSNGRVYSGDTGPNLKMYALAAPTG